MGNASLRAPGGKGGSKARGPKVIATLRICAARVAMGKSNMPTGLLLLLVTIKQMIYGCKMCTEKNVLIPIHFVLE